MKTENNFEDLRGRTEEMVREYPAQSAVAALVAGFAFALLPIGSIIFGIIRLALHLVKPALLIFGAVKLFEECSARCDRSDG